MTLTELLQPPQVDAVLGPVLLGGADKEVTFLQDEEGPLPALGVQHALVAQLAHALELVTQQAVAAHGGEPLWDGAGDEQGENRALTPRAEPHEDGGGSLGMVGAPGKGGERGKQGQSLGTLWSWLTLPMALAQACSVSGPSVPSCCTFSPVRKSSRVKRNLQRMKQLMKATLSQSQSSHCMSRKPSPAVYVPHTFWACLGVPLSGARAGDSLVGSVDAQGDEIPAVNVTQGLSALLSVEEEQGSLQGAPRALEVCRNRGSVALGWAPSGCPPTLPTLTLFAFPGPWEL